MIKILIYLVFFLKVWTAYFGSKAFRICFNGVGFLLGRAFFRREHAGKRRLILVLVTLFELSCLRNKKVDQDSDASVQKTKMEEQKKMEEEKKIKNKDLLEGFKKWKDNSSVILGAHIDGIIARNPYKDFGAETGSSALLVEEDSFDPEKDFENLASVTSIPVPTNEFELSKLKSSMSNFALSGEKPAEKKKTLMGLLKGLFEALECTSPIRGVYVYVAKDLPAQGFSKILGKAVQKFKGVPNLSILNGLMDRLPSLSSNTLGFGIEGDLGIEGALAGGITVEGGGKGDVIFAVKAKGVNFFGFEYLKTLEYSTANGPKHGTLVGDELSGLPVPVIPNTRAAIGWNKHEGSMLFFQEIAGTELELGVQIILQAEKIAKLLDPDPNKCKAKAGAAEKH